MVYNVNGYGCSMKLCFFIRSFWLFLFYNLSSEVIAAVSGLVGALVPKDRWSLLEVLLNITCWGGSKKLEVR